MASIASPVRRRDMYNHFGERGKRQANAMYTALGMIGTRQNNGQRSLVPNVDGSAMNVPISIQT
jgi:hypothetical protein